MVPITRQFFALVGFLTLLALPCLNSSREFITDWGPPKRPARPKECHEEEANGTTARGGETRS